MVQWWLIQPSSNDWGALSPPNSLKGRGIAWLWEVYFVLVFLLLQEETGFGVFFIVAFFCFVLIWLFLVRDQTQVSCIAGRFLTSWATREFFPSTRFTCSEIDFSVCWKTLELVKNGHVIFLYPEWIPLAKNLHYFPSHQSPPPLFCKSTPRHSRNSVHLTTLSPDTWRVRWTLNTCPFMLILDSVLQRFQSRMWDWVSKVVLATGILM